MSSLSGRNWIVHIGDVLDVLRTLPGDSVQCVVTSPPYYGLRDYGTATWGGGDANCDHNRPPLGGSGEASLVSSDANGDKKAAYRTQQYREICGKCGAIRIDQQIGLEATPAEFVAKLVEVFREVRRVLRPDGVLFVNMGDSYNAATSSPRQGTQSGDVGRWSEPGDGNTRTNFAGLKPKDLCMMPWRLFLALQDSGWWCRDIIAWAKKSPMPESVTDRCTKSWEPIGMFTKSAAYYWDAEAVREANQGDPPWGDKRNFKMNDDAAQGEHGATSFMAGGTKEEFIEKYYTSGRNLRNVWHLGSDPFPDAHFATFVRAIPERCIKAASSDKGCCPKCGAPWARLKERVSRKVYEYESIGIPGEGKNRGRRTEARGSSQFKATGWQPSCECDAGDPVPCIVLDPFSGSGTSGMVATELGRRYVGIELSEKYAEMSRKRIESWKTRDAEKQPESAVGQQSLFAD